MIRPAVRSCLALVLLASVLTGCRDEPVAVYRIPKEKEAVRPQRANAPHGMGQFGSDMGGAAVASTEGATLGWTAPAGWRANHGSTVRKGSFTIGPEGGATADLAITAFPGDVGGNLANVNRWRGQLQMGPISAQELPAVLTHVDHNGLHMDVVELVNGEGPDALRMLSAIVPFDGATWFFKLTGPSELVAGEKQAFMAFLGTVKPIAQPAPTVAADPHAGLDLPPAGSQAPSSMPASAAVAAGPAGAMASTPVTTADGPALRWTPPAHWQSKSGSTTRKGSYLIEEGDELADVSITAFPGEVGGELANVNRWREQLQLPRLDAAQLESTLTRQRINGLSVTIVDLTGAGGAAGQRMLGAIVPYDNATWFIKLAGSDPLVAREKPAFLSFLSTLQTP